MRLTTETTHGTNNIETLTLTAEDKEDQELLRMVFEQIKKHIV